MKDLRVSIALALLDGWIPTDLEVEEDLPKWYKKDMACGMVIYEDKFSFWVQSDSNPNEYHLVSHDGTIATHCTCDGVEVFKHPLCRHMKRIRYCLRLRWNRVDGISPSVKIDEPRKSTDDVKGVLSSASGKGFSLLR